ncbi:DUF1847 domain-containing protein [Candidatus Zixiibacteriota bacterium]
MTSGLPKCANCNVVSEERICRNPDGVGPGGCPTVEMEEVVARATAHYDDPSVHEFARQASIQEAEGYGNRDRKPYVKHPIKPRLEEIIDFSRRMGYRRLGIAFCAGLHAEADLFDSVLTGVGFETVSVVCKVGCTPKETIGLEDHEKMRIGEFESMCSPIAQAELLNESDTDFNILLGLCVGHDSLFFRYSVAPVTVFAAKDRVMGHNPIAALYTLGSYSERFAPSD